MNDLQTDKRITKLEFAFSEVKAESAELLHFFLIDLPKDTEYQEACAYIYERVIREHLYWVDIVERDMMFVYDMVDIHTILFRDIIDNYHSFHHKKRVRYFHRQIRRPELQDQYMETLMGRIRMMKQYRREIAEISPRRSLEAPRSSLLLSTGS